MGLTSCPDCNKEVSDRAPNCPNCGRPLASFSSRSVQTRRKGGKYEGVGFLLILAGIVSCFYSPEPGALLIIVGFIVFLLGRFM
jgi:predicted amidophosphoribosyltransferase